MLRQHEEGGEWGEVKHAGGWAKDFPEMQQSNPS